MKHFQCDDFIKDISEYLPEFAHCLELLGGGGEECDTPKAPSSYTSGYIYSKSIVAPHSRCSQISSELIADTSTFIGGGAKVLKGGEKCSIKYT